MNVTSVLDQFVGGSYKSRKFLLALLALLIITGVSLGGIWSVTLAGVMPSFISGILGVLSLYYAGNIAKSYVASKVLGLANTTESKTEKEI